VATIVLQLSWRNVNIAAVKQMFLPIRYQIISGPTGFNTATNSSGTFQGLAPGNYVFSSTRYQNGLFLKILHCKWCSRYCSWRKCAYQSLFWRYRNNSVYSKWCKDRGYNYIIRNAANATILIMLVKPLQQLMFLLQPAGVFYITVTDRKTLCSDDYSAP
jgi:hypothetical protein